MKIKFDKNSKKLIEEIYEIGRRLENQDILNRFEGESAKARYIDEAQNRNDLIDEILFKLPGAKFIPKDIDDEYDAMLVLARSAYNQCLVHVIDVLESFKK